MDLIMFPGDATFSPYTGKHTSESSENVTSPTDGRIYALKFSSSSQRHFFWLQSKSQKEGKPNWFSPRDLKLGQIVDLILSGEEVDVQTELQEVETGPGGQGDDDDDQDMEDAPESPNNTRFRANSTGGAGAGATGGDVRDEGEGAREGGADGGRA
jgi:26S proteasome regulatory subunit N13